MSEQALTEIISQNKFEQCIAFFREMPEAERRKLAPLCLKLLKQVKKDGGNVITAEAAVLATAAFSELKAISWHVAREEDLAFAVVGNRRPEWTAQWAERLLGQSYYWFYWGLVRRLVRAGLMPKPDSPNYVLAMIMGIVGGPYERDVSIEERLLADPELLDDEVWKLFEYDGGGENSLANYDRFGRSQRWHEALLKLAAAGRLPRERLLSCSLDALERDFNQYRAKWFAAFHDALAPTPEEFRENGPRYLRLVGASASNIASWAMEKVERLAREGAFDAATLIGGLQPALTSRQKGFPKRALAVLDAAAQSSPATAAGAVRVAVTALAHEATDVQKGALDLLERHAGAVDKDLAATIASYAPSVAASLRPRLERWSPAGGEKKSSKKDAKTKSKGAPSADLPDVRNVSPQLKKLLGIDALLENLEIGRAEIPAATFDGTEIPRLKNVAPLQPIADLDELIDVCAAATEDEERVDDAERAFDGLSRLCDQKPDDFARRAGPLIKRVKQILKKQASPFLGNGPGDDLCGVVHAWTTGEVIQWKPNPERRNRTVVATIDGEQHTWFTENMKKGLGFLSRRSIALAERVAAGKPAVLLSAPTHAGGWIDPAVLVKRVKAWSGDDPDLHDACLAMLRLAPEGRAEAVKSLKDSKSEWIRAMRFALGAVRVTLGKTPSLWIAAARARGPWSDDERVEKAFPDRGPDAGRAASYAVNFKKERYHTNLKVQSDPPPPKAVEPELVTVVLHSQRGVGRDLQWELGGPAGRTVGSVRWTATIWPQARESFFAAALEALAWNIDWSEVAWQNKALLEPLLDSSAPLREMGVLLLATGLAAKEPGEYGLATDIAIRAIEDGRLGSDNFGPALAQLLPTGLIKAGRWQKTLAEVARVSPLHGLVVQLALQTSLRGKPNLLPRDYGKLLEMLLELSIELDQPIADPECRVFLEQGASGKTGKLAKQLLNLPAADFCTAAGPILVQAIQHRAAAAERLSV